MHPRISRVDQVDQQFLTSAKQVFDEATKSGNKVTAEQIAATLAAVSGEDVGGPSALPSGPIPAGTWVDLLALVNVRTDRTEHDNVFSWADDGVLVMDAHWGSIDRLAAPVIPHGSYELSVEVSFKNEQKMLELLLPVGSSNVWLYIGNRVPGGKAGPWAGIDLVRGNRAWDNESTTRGFQVETNRKYALNVSVQLRGKMTRIEASLDGKSITRWEGPASSLGEATKQQGQRIGVAGDQTSALFSKVHLRMTSGQAVIDKPKRPFASGAGNLADKVDLTSKAVEVTTLDTRLKFTRSRNQIVMTGSPACGEVESLRCTLGDLVWGEGVRLRWRVDPPEAGQVIVGCWPLAGVPLTSSGWVRGIVVNTRTKGCGISIKPFEAAGFKAWTPPAAEIADIYPKDGPFDICFEYRNNTVAAWLNSTKVAEVELTPSQTKSAARMPLEILVNVGPKGETAKLTLLELRLGKDIPPYQPASQPDTFAP
ncbi:MAG: hypothetical protein PHU85_12555 [Phycisphaerae bacterium]|nr:hypothetical protein [Phycisphaerae bacterium]